MCKQIKLFANKTCQKVQQYPSKAKRINTNVYVSDEELN